jgi:hypothetical protein
VGSIGGINQTSIWKILTYVTSQLRLQPCGEELLYGCKFSGPGSDKVLRRQKFLFMKSCSIRQYHYTPKNLNTIRRSKNSLWQLVF